MVLSVCRLVLFTALSFAVPLFAHIPPSALTSSFHNGRASFAVEINNATSTYDVRTVLVLPGETVKIASDVPLTLEAQGKRVGEANTEFVWTSPRVPGNYHLDLYHKASHEKVAVQVFVLTPRNQVKGYLIGNYPERGGRYERPRGFIKVTEEDQDLKVSPHFQLKQFLCKQAGGFPKYVLVEERLLTKLEQILERINLKGYRADSLHVMSGFRTPAYNRKLGNVSLSRHMFGDAADIYVEGTDGKMADINQDGKRNLADAEYLRKLILDLEAEGRSDFLPGGVGHYKSTHSHGPYVHVDARGEKARWAGAGIASANSKPGRGKRS